MAAPTGVRDRLDHCGGHGRTGRLANGVGERFEVIDAGIGELGVDVEPHHLPAPRRGQPVGVSVAQVIGVRFRVRRERSDDRR